MVVLTSARNIAVQATKARVPMIKFRKGGLISAQKPESSRGVPSQSTQAATACINELALPIRFKRQPLDEKEIEYINRGGPD